MTNSFHKSWQKDRPACLFHLFAYNLVNEDKDCMEEIDKDMNVVNKMDLLHTNL